MTTPENANDVELNLSAATALGDLSSLNLAIFVAAAAINVDISNAGLTAT